MRRREFLSVLGGAAAMPLAAHAQQSLPVIGFLGSASAGLWASRVQAFRQGLKESGFVEGQNVAIEFRWAEGHIDRLPSLAADLVGRKVAIIVANGPAVRVAKAATATIPIVFQIGGDPVAAGFVASLNRPGGNLTGVTSLSAELGPKRLQLLHELNPAAAVIAALVNPWGPNAEAEPRDFQMAAQVLGLQLHILHAHTESDFAPVFASLAERRVAGLVIGSDAFFNTQARRLAELAVRHAVATVFQFREFAMAGGLLSYGDSLTDRSRQVGSYAGRILKGEKPSDLPVQQSSKAELIVNLKTAKALGIEIPLALLGRADEVIE